MLLKCCLVILGTTASGKSKLSQYIHRHIPSNIINADSQQVYAELPILTDQPLQLTDHYLYGHKSIFDDYNSFMWSQDASIEIYKSISNKRLPILVGGSGFYIRNLICGHTIEDTHASESIKTKLFCPDIKFIRVLIMPDKNYTSAQIKTRVFDMFPTVIDEIKNIISYPKHKRVIGDQEIISYINHEIDIQKCIHQIITKTIQYAKRQRTWFKHQMKYDLVLENIEPVDQQIKRVLEVLNGRSGIRTHEAFTLSGFQDQHHQPLGHPSDFVDIT